MNLDWLPLARTPLLEAALAYARNGWPVFPLDGKDPCVKRGFLVATTDEAQIRAWWSRWPRANIGALPPGLWALDVDVRRGGHRALLELERQHEPLPLTTRQSTGRGDGSEHWIFVKPKDREVRQGADFAPGLDTRVGGRGYLVVAPSTHPETGGRYTWLSVVAPVEAPAWLLSLVEKRKPAVSIEVQPRDTPRIVSDKQATYAQLSCGGWGVRLTVRAVPGEIVAVKRKNGPACEELLTREAEHFTLRDGSDVWLWETDGRWRFAQLLLERCVDEVRQAKKGERNQRLNNVWYRLSGFRDVLDENRARSLLLSAARDCGLDDAEAEKVLRCRRQ
jgi:hypothetical protein